MTFHKYALDSEIVADYLQEVSTDDTEQMSVVGRRNEAVSAWIDSYCKRRKGYFLAAPDTATPKQIRGENKNYLILPPHIFGAVAVSGVSSSAYYESDKNGWLYARLLGAETVGDYFDECSSFWSANRLYSVSARWGFEQTPAEIIEAVKQTVARWFAQGAGILGDVTPTGFVIERDAPPSAKLLLAPFVRREFERD